MTPVGGLVWSSAYRTRFFWCVRKPSTTLCLICIRTNTCSLCMLELVGRLSWRDYYGFSLSRMKNVNQLSIIIMVSLRRIVQHLPHVFIRELGIICGNRYVHILSDERHVKSYYFPQTLSESVRRILICACWA